MKDTGNHPNQEGPALVPGVRDPRRDWPGGPGRAHVKLEDKDPGFGWTRELREAPSGGRQDFLPSSRTDTSR